MSLKETWAGTLRLEIEGLIAGLKLRQAVFSMGMELRQQIRLWR